ncbi:MAG: ATP-binding cassette domain-containing protein [Acidimicrobiales bacterium]
MTAWRAALRAERRRATLALGAGLLVGVAAVGLAATAGWLIVRAAERPVLLTLSVAIGLVQLFALARAAGRYLERTATHGATLRILARVRAALARELEPLVPAGLGPRGADVVDAVVRDAERVEESLTSVASPLVAGGVVSVVTAGLVALVSWAAAAALGAGLAVLALLAVVGARGASVAEAADDTARASLRALIDAVARDPAASALGEGVGALRARASALDELLGRARRARARWRGVLEGGATGVAGLVVVAVLVGQAHAGLTGPRAAAVVLAVLAALELLEGVGGLASWRGVARARSRLGSLAGTPPVREPVDEAHVAGSHVSVADLAIAFDRPVLAHLSLELAPGERVLLRGPSGAGKTATAWVLARLLDPAGGAVRLEGVDYARLAGSTVRASVLLVEDAPYVFVGSLADNLRVADDAASDEQLGAALAAVGLAHLAARPGGLDAPLRGAETALSGGERVRLGVARARLARRAVLLLDEPTEGLDGLSAARLIASLADLAGAVLVISHRSEVAAVATRIVEVGGVGGDQEAVAQPGEVGRGQSGVA